jgi:signal peptidase I
MLRLAFAPAWIAVALIAMAQAGCQGGGVRILSSSMEPTLHCAKPGPGCESKTADYVRQVPDDTLERGNIIAFKVPPRTPVKCGNPKETVLIFVKRLIGLPGERWSISNGFVYINGRRLHEPYVPLDERDRLSFPGGRVPKRKYFVLGDNRIMSCDSRIWGYVPAKRVIARVIAIERGNRTIKLR